MKGVPQNPGVTQRAGHIKGSLTNALFNNQTRPSLSINVMNDEILQINKETFDRIILAIILISLAAGGTVLFTAGVFSPWFALCASLLLMAIIAYVIRLVGRLVVASHVLVLELIGLVVAVIFRAGTVSGIALYLFIPIAMISGLLLSPIVTLVIVLGLIASAILLLAVLEPLSLAMVAALLPALGLTLLVAMLAALNKRNILLLSNRLLENRTLLRERALELMQSAKKVEFLEQKTHQLQKQLDTVQSATARLKSTVSQENTELYNLMQGTIGELKQSIETLEQSIEKIGDMPTLNGHAEVVEMAWQKLYRLKTLAINVEEMVQVDRDEFELSLETVNVAQLIGDVAGTARGLAREKNIQVKDHVADDVPPIEADPTRLRQVLLQLVSNAVKFTDQGIIEIRAELDRGQLVIFVSDTGIGMSGEEANRVFEKFGRAGSGPAHERQGTGLGLAISKKLVERHGGRIWVSSVQGVGSTFYFSLPLKAVRRQVYPAASVSGKTTVRLEGIQTRPISKVRVGGPAAASDDDATVVLAGAPKTEDNGGATQIMAGPVAQIRPKVTQRLPVPVTGRSPSPRPTQPIHRYQPKYIQRFGFILLALLVVVLLTVGSVALVNYLSGNLPPALTENLGLAEAGAPSVTATTATAAVAAPPTSSPTARPSPTSSSTPLSLPSPTLIPPSPTAAIVAVSTPTLLPATPTDTPPPATPTATPVPSQTPTPPAAPTSPPVPTSTPTVPPPPLAPVSSVDGALPASPGDNSRVSRSVGGQLVFSGEQNNQRDIFVLASDGVTRINLTNSPGDDFQPDWSPNGRQIVFSSGRTGSFNIFLMDADGSNLTQLTDSLAFDEWPVWSPDGQKIAFVSDRTGNVELYVMDAGGSHLQPLTHNPADDWPAVWSPDGRWLVFSSNRDGNWNLYIISAQGGQPVRLTGAPGDERDPIWSPDGATIGFVSNRGGNFDVYTLPLPNGIIAEVPPEQWTQITNTPQNERYPTWMPAH